jgi:hypothetical protein
MEHRVIGVSPQNYENLVSENHELRQLLGQLFAMWQELKEDMAQLKEDTVKLKEDTAKLREDTVKLK